MSLVIRSLLSLLVFTVAYMSTTLVSTRLSYDIPRSYVHQVVGMSSDSQQGPSGSAVVLAPGLMITAAHVVDHPSFKFYINGKPVEVLKLDRDRDLALLKVDVGCPCAPLASDSPYMDEEVVAIGYPLGYPQTLTEGRWQYFLQDGEVVSTTSIAFGNSGGGLFHFNWLSFKWELVGVTNQVPGANLGFCGIPVFTITRSVPVESILYFIHHSVKVESGQSQ